MSEDVLALHTAFASLVEVSSPEGAPWEFLVIFATLLLGPLIVQRARIPGIIGLLRRRLRDRPARPRPDRLGQQHAA